MHYIYNLIITFIIVYCSGFFSYAMPCVSEEEKQALIDFYYSTGGDNWINKDNWLSDDDVCKWYGIVCSLYEIGSEECYVFSISLPKNNLVGKINDSFDRLQNLTYLKLSGNQLTELPENFGNLFNLSELNLNNNQLTDLPESFGNLNNLSLLAIGGNQLTILPDGFGNLFNLSELILSNNQLTDLPESFGNLNNLSLLFINHNQLTNLPESFVKLNNLFDLIIFNNQLTNLPEGFGKLNNLFNLYICNNQLTGLPESFGSLNNLYWLSIENNQLTSLPESFGNLNNLSLLKIEDNQLTNLPDSFVNLSKLSKLYLKNNQLTMLPDNFGKLNNLSELYLYNNQLTELPESFGNLSKLSILNIYNNQLTNLPDTFCNLESLSDLELPKNKLTNLPDSFGRLIQLKILDLYNNILNKLPENFDDLENLSDLDISNNKLESLPESFGSLIKLSYLDISNNILKILPETFGKLENLKHLDISNNKLPELLDTFFYKFINLEYLNLSNNILNKLPTSIVKLENLSNLNLSNNFLNSLPENISNLKKLTNLILTNNELESLPDDLSELENLSNLDIANNNLKSLPDTFDLLKILSNRLNLSNNNLTSLPDDFGKLKEISYLDISNNQLETLPLSFCNLIELSYLYLSNNDLAVLPKCIGNLKKLSDFYLSNNQLEELPESFGELQNLSDLYLNNNRLNSLNENFGNLQKLNTLNLDYNKLDELPESFGNLQNLLDLNLNSNQLKTLPENFSNLITLRDLFVSNNLMVSVPEPICNLSSLKNLDISKNKIDSLPDSIDKLDNLIKINLSNNLFFEFPYELTYLESLIELDISYNMISESSSDHLYQQSLFDNLITLDMSYNSDISFIDGLFNMSFTNIQYLDLSNSTNDDYTINFSLFSNLNNLKHLILKNSNITIDNKIEYLENLNTLNISNSHVNYISKSLYNLNNLQSLDLSNSQFELEDKNIPIEFSKLKNLKYINFKETGLYTSSPALDKFISERSSNWVNNITVSPEQQGISIHYITTTSDSFGYSSGAQIPVSIIFTEPVSLTGSNLILSFENIGHTVTILPFPFSYTATGLFTVNPEDFSDDLSVKSIELACGGILQNINGENVKLELPSKGNLNHIKNVYVDGTEPIINITHPIHDQCLNYLNIISYNAGDRSGDYSVMLSIKNKNGVKIWDNKERHYIFPEIEQNSSIDTTMVQWKDNMSYTLTAIVKDFAGNTKTQSINFSYGQKDSKITLNLINDKIIVGQSAKINGLISPTNEILGEKVFIDFINPYGASKLSRQVNADEDGGFQYNTLCNEIDISGEWVIKARWFGNSCLAGSESLTKTLYVSRAKCEIYLDSTYNRIKQGGTISISGKFIPQYNCGNNKENVPITLRFIGPSYNFDEEIKTKNSFGGFSKSFSNTTEIGEWNIQASIDSDAYQTFISDNLKIQVVETAGYAIIVQGKIEGDEGLASHNKTANSVYWHFRKRGLQDDDIIYFNHNIDQVYYQVTDKALKLLNENIENKLNSIKHVEYHNKDEFINKIQSLGLEQYQSDILEKCEHKIVDYFPTQEGIKNAIEKGISEHMGDKQANVYIVMIDHGSEDSFYIGDGNIITDKELSEWITTLESSTDWTQEIVVILGFCMSGSFIDKLSNNNRVIITSTGPGEFSYKGPLEQDEIREGEFFISEFFKNVSYGKSLREAFQDAVIQTELFTEFNPEKKFEKVKIPPYFDFSMQHPLIDDNGDKIGTNDLSIYNNSKRYDGDLAKKITIGVNPLTVNATSGILEITGVSETIFLSSDEKTTNKLWMGVNDNQKVLSTWIEIKKPDLSINSYVTEGTDQIEMPLITVTTAKHYTNNNRYVYENIGNIFDLPGIYQIFYFAKEIHTKYVSKMKESRVYKASKTNKKPNNFSLISPLNNLKITSSGVLSDCEYSDFRCYTHFSWNVSEDPDNDFVTYTLLISRDNADFTEKEKMIIIERLTQTSYQIYLPGFWDNSKVYWKVQCIDIYGAITESGVYSFNVDNANNFKNLYIELFITDLNNNAVNDVKCEMYDKLLEKIDSNIVYQDMSNQGKYIINVDEKSLSPITLLKNGFYPKKVEINKLPESNINFVRKLKMDVKIKKVYIKDIIMIMKLLSGMDVDNSILMDLKTYFQKFELKELIYIFQLFAQST